MVMSGFPRLLDSLTSQTLLQIWQHKSVNGLARETMFHHGLFYGADKEMADGKLQLLELAVPAAVK